MGFSPKPTEQTKTKQRQDLEHFPQKKEVFQNIAPPPVPPAEVTILMQMYRILWKFPDNSKAAIFVVFGRKLLFEVYSRQAGGGGPELWRFQTNHADSACTLLVGRTLTMDVFVGRPLLGDRLQPVPGGASCFFKKTKQGD